MPVGLSTREQSQTIIYCKKIFNLLVDISFVSPISAELFPD